MNSLIIFLTSVEHATFVFKNIYIRGFPTTTLTTILFFSMMAEGGNDFLGIILKLKALYVKRKLKYMKKKRIHVYWHYLTDTDAYKTLLIQSTIEFDMQIIYQHRVPVPKIC
ncbi:hypothetical protein Anas_02883 [Armadillidium nasatum]|uniref:Uncharacterized protein n=1 Tax=Armadillidium nasatum TaxID=96803 RepID=A0A5N5SWL3_9CRUS|nr:hypothetical protein Anas_02883 [Armadillidium nasatum]